MMKSRDFILQGKGLHKTFFHPARVTILKNLDLEVQHGETVAIMGRSGEGKSTLLQILGTLESPCSGELTIDGELVTAFNRNGIRNRKLAFIFQSFHLLEDYTALENVLMPARIGRQATAAGTHAYERACSLLEHVGLAERMKFNTKLLSGGEKQRVAIARALCNDPDLILADEPSGNLDRHTAHHIHELLLNFAAVNRKTLIVVTHDPQLAQLCHTRYQLSEGTLHSM